MSARLIKIIKQVWSILPSQCHSSHILGPGIETGLPNHGSTDWVMAPVSRMVPPCCVAVPPWTIEATLEAKSPNMGITWRAKCQYFFGCTLAEPLLVKCGVVISLYDIQICTYGVCVWHRHTIFKPVPDILGAHELVMDCVPATALSPPNERVCPENVSCVPGSNFEATSRTWTLEKMLSYHWCTYVNSRLNLYVREYIFLDWKMVQLEPRRKQMKQASCNFRHRLGRRVTSEHRSNISKINNHMRKIKN